jgi:hypothetical protein
LYSKGKKSISPEFAQALGQSTKTFYFYKDWPLITDTNDSWTNFQKHW